MKTSTYDAQAAAFLERHGFTLKIDLRTPETCPPWSAEDAKRSPTRGTCPSCKGTHGREYLVTLTPDPGRRGLLSFAFWGAHADRPHWEREQMGDFHHLDGLGKRGSGATGKKPSAYDVLACLSSDASTSDDPDEVVREFGEMLPSRALAIAEHARKVRAFFTEAELAELAEIQ